MIINNESDPCIYIIILNWNGKFDTLECLASVSKVEYPNFKIIVVDNGSSDNSEKEILKVYPDITLLQTGKNLGYAGGNNVGISWALEHDADYILLLNNDTTVAPNLLTIFINSSKSLPTESILGAKIYYFDQPDVIWYAGGCWSGYAKGFEHIGIGLVDSEVFNQLIKTDYVTGCVLFAGAETFTNVGLLDENFFLTYEETDWCYRARKKGSDCFVIPEAKVWHKVSASFGGSSSPLITYFLYRNKPYWVKKNLPTLDRWLLHVNIVTDLLSIVFPPFYLMPGDMSFVKRIYWSLCAWLRNFKSNIKDPYVKSKYLGYYDFYRNRFGNISDSTRDRIN